MDHNEELEALLDLLAGVKRWIRRSIDFGWSALFGRAVAVTLALMLLFLLMCFGRPNVKTYPKVRVLISQAVDADTGLPVSRPEWIANATAAAQN